LKASDTTIVKWNFAVFDLLITLANTATSHDAFLRSLKFGYQTRVPHSRTFTTERTGHDLARSTQMVKRFTLKAQTFYQDS